MTHKYQQMQFIKPSIIVFVVSLRKRFRLKFVWVGQQLHLLKREILVDLRHSRIILDISEQRRLRPRFLFLVMLNVLSQGLLLNERLFLHWVHKILNRGRVHRALRSIGSQLILSRPIEFRDRFNFEMIPEVLNLFTQLLLLSVLVQILLRLLRQILFLLEYLFIFVFLQLLLNEYQVWLLLSLFWPLLQLNYVDSQLFG